MGKSLWRKYVDYLNDNPKGYWFKSKVYGWGWIPATKQGWAVTILFLVLILVVGFDFALNERALESNGILYFYLKIIVLVILLIAVCYKTGEKPEWSWGFKKK